MEIRIERSWNSSYPPAWRRTRSAAPERHWPPLRQHEGHLGRPRDGSQAVRFPESPRNNGLGPPSTLRGNARHHRHRRSQKNLTMRLAQRMQHQRACRPWEEDEDYHSRQTYGQVRTVHHHEQKMLISPHASKALVHWHILL